MFGKKEIQKNASSLISF